MLTACGPNPAAGNNPGGSTSGGSTSGGSTSGGATAGGSVGGTTNVATILSSKQSYVAYLNCIKTKASADQRAGIDQAIVSVNAIPDSTWAVISASMTASAQAYAKLYVGC
ncbi:MAG: hypothetical protein CVV27_04010 [Candidatus Melainabacteria bacterium HGW-Melainabacteria-1]|nr:MAG: hypothetical protein CVV27_04010 [Candidatus Melainabacteria bacterium HGW-Melainabacteria-1]